MTLASATNSKTVPSSTPTFVFGRKTSPSDASSTRAKDNRATPQRFTFPTNLLPKNDKFNSTKPTPWLPSSLARETARPLRDKERRAKEEYAKEEQVMRNRTSTAEVTSPLYDLSDVKAATEELQHLKKGSSSESTEHEIRTAPLITREAFVAAGFKDRAVQYGVLGETLSIHSKSGVHVPIDPRLYINTNAPLSAIVCGVQGSGKSHTVSVLLENMFIPDQGSIGSLNCALSGLVLHFGEGGPGSRPCEAAWVGASSQPDVRPPKVRVYVSRSSLHTMESVYAPLGDRVRVSPLLLNESELDTQAILSMMAVGSSESAPLYIQIVLSILRDLGEKFSYTAFLRRLEVEKRSFNAAQVAGLEQRLALLNSFMEPQTPQSRGSSNKSKTRRFSEGKLTIIDLSDPFIDPASACGLFEIVTRLFVRADVGTGKVLVVDEAHKYLSASRGAAGLTNALLTLTREQRHLGMRVIISTQEPTVIPPVLMDLCTVAIMHRFSSPAWWDHLARHVATDVSADQGFEAVVKLKTGEALVLAPSGLGVFPDDDLEKSGTDTGKQCARANIPLRLGQFGRRFLLMKTRARITKDGGASVLVLVSESEGEESDDE
ncbi:hypothetical protein EDD16DRAFT_1609606 [Pisolithus croceorrhizus]|nr:hypothetical protein EDD16DRAFT_1609606 [Pisolithus croceorrhizus]KAI6120080.1 hypothetical protein EV401DRAFT_1958397 [Pisolithus croceorrhizus]KAI6158311.1 hypothetical protein EDD17DRAFT_1623465 [Pisolithus thermaeus]